MERESLWHHIQEMMNHPVWAYNAVYNTEWVIWEVVKFQLDWWRLHSQMSERISQVVSIQFDCLSQERRTYDLYLSAKKPFQMEL